MINISEYIMPNGTFILDIKKKLDEGSLKAGVVKFCSAEPQHVLQTIDDLTADICGYAEDRWTWQIQKAIFTFNGPR